jgi:hypothetical protein
VLNLLFLWQILHVSLLTVSCGLAPDFPKVAATPFPKRKNPEYNSGVVGAEAMVEPRESTTTPLFRLFFR